MALLPHISLNRDYDASAPAAQDRVSASKIDADHATIVNWLNNTLVPTLNAFLRDDKTLHDRHVRSRMLHRELTDRIYNPNAPAPLEIARVVATTNTAITGLPGSVDNVTMADGDRILLVGQTDKSENGLWLVNSGGAWTRPADYASGSTAPALTNVKIKSGTVYIDARFQLEAAVVVDSGDATWLQMEAGIEVGETALVLPVGTTARKLGDVLSDEYNVAFFGAAPNQDSTSHVQAAVDAAAAVATTTSPKVVRFYQMYGVSASISVPSNVFLDGPGGLYRLDGDSPSGSAFALLVLDGSQNVKITNLALRCAGYDARLNVPLTKASSLGDDDSCIDMHGAENVEIASCWFTRFSYAVKMSECRNIRIHDNYAHAETSKTLESLDDGTYVPYSSLGGGGIALAGQRLGQVQNGCYDLNICDNTLLCIGLDQGVDAGSQGYESFRVTVHGNIIVGSHTGVQSYTGTLTDPGVATSTDRMASIRNNTCILNYEQGIYARGVAGVHIGVNRLIRPAIHGGEESGASRGAILQRIYTSQTYTNSSVSHDLGNSIVGNMIIDPGRPSDGAIDAAIRCDAQYSLVADNHILRSADRFGANLRAKGIGISWTGHSIQKPAGQSIHGNVIRGFLKGINIAGGPGGIEGYGSEVIEGNWIEHVDVGIVIDTGHTGYVIKNGAIRDCATAAIKLRRVGQTVVESVPIHKSPIGIQVANGCYTSFFYGQAARVGATIGIRNIDCSDVVEPLKMVNTSGNDYNLMNRLIFADNIRKDGVLQQYFAASSASTLGNGSSRSFRKGERYPNSSIAAGGYAEWICVENGTRGTLSTTATTTSGNASVIFASMEGIVPGVFIDVAGVSEVLEVESIDMATNTAVMVAAPSASVSGAAASYHPPVFKGCMAIGA